MIDNRVEKIKYHMDEVLKLLNIEITPSTEGTSLRVAKMWSNEVFKNRNNRGIEELDASMKTFPVEDSRSNLVIMNVPFHSTCEHHLMPFFGIMSIGYVPKESIIGLSKIPRVVDFFSRKPQLQERLVREICEYLFNIINPAAIFVLAHDTIHTCVQFRGIECEADTETFYQMGNASYSDIDYIECKKEFLLRVKGGEDIG